MQLKRMFFPLALVLLQLTTNAQDTLTLACPLPNGSIRIVRPSDKAYAQTSEYGVMLSSRNDTTVQACYQGRVVIVKPAEDNKYDMVISFKGYFFWYAGVVSPKVKEGTVVKPGDIIGTYTPGDLLELLMFNQDEPVSPRKYLHCK